MSLRDDLDRWTPRLRRYARALCPPGADQIETADDIVHAALVRLLKGDRPRHDGDLAVLCYSAVTEAHREHVQRAEMLVARRDANGELRALRLPYDASARPQSTTLTNSLAALRLGDREALLLVGLEQCGHAQAARILRITRAELIIRLTRARTALGRALGDRDDAPGTARGHLRVVK